MKKFADKVAALEARRRPTRLFPEIRPGDDPKVAAAEWRRRYGREPNMILIIPDERPYEPGYP